jgi:2-keto-4-pentenoate hydratase
MDELRACVASVHPAIELADWRFAADATPDLAAVEADGAGAHGFVLGPASDPAALDLARATAVLERDGRILGRGQGSDALGSPWLALLWLARELRERGLALEAGEVVLTGALGPVHTFAPEAAAGRYRATIEGLGSVEVEIRSPR